MTYEQLAELLDREFSEDFGYNVTHNETTFSEYGVGAQAYTLVRVTILDLHGAPLWEYEQWAYHESHLPAVRAEVAAALKDAPRFPPLASVGHIVKRILGREHRGRPLYTRSSHSPYHEPEAGLHRCLQRLLWSGRRVL